MDVAEFRADYEAQAKQLRDTWPEKMGHMTAKQLFLLHLDVRRCNLERAEHDFAFARTMLENYRRQYAEYQDKAAAFED